MNALCEIEIMLAELESNRLEVALVPQRVFTNEGGMIRVAVSRNCDWYRRFCGTYPSSRMRKKAAFDTAIRRANTVRALNGILSGKPRSKYADHLLAIAKARAKRAAA